MSSGESAGDDAPARPRWPVHWPDDLDPACLRQPDARSCAAASVLAARVLLRPPWRPVDPVREIVAEHRALTSARSPRDRFQVPWPRALGTPPWAVANALRALSGRHLATVNARPRPVAGYEVLVEQLSLRPVAIYLGDRWLPRHVVLAIAAPDHGLSVQVLDPATGTIRTVKADDWRSHRVGVAGWSHLWFVV